MYANDAGPISSLTAWAQGRTVRYTKTLEVIMQRTLRVNETLLI